MNRKLRAISPEDDDKDEKSSIAKLNSFLGQDTTISIANATSIGSAEFLNSLSEMQPTYQSAIVPGLRIGEDLVTRATTTPDYLNLTGLKEPSIHGVSEVSHLGGKLLFDPAFGNASLLGGVTLESPAEREEKESREKNTEILQEIKEIKKSNPTKEQLDELFERVGSQLTANTQMNSPSAILERLSSMLGDMAIHNRVSELQKLEEFFANGKCFLWTCGFGHMITQVNTLTQLHHILNDQTKGEIQMCQSHGHKSFLLISNGNLLTVGIEDLNNKKIRGGKNKKEKKKK